MVEDTLSIGGKLLKNRSKEKILLDTHHAVTEDTALHQAQGFHPICRFTLLHETCNKDIVLECVGISLRLCIKRLQDIVMLFPHILPLCNWLRKNLCTNSTE